MRVLQRGPLHPRQGPTPGPLTAGQEFDVLGRVATAYQQARAAEATLAAAVTRARQSGASWSVIGAQLGVSHQAAQQRCTRAYWYESPGPLPENDLRFPTPGGGMGSKRTVECGQVFWPHCLTTLKR